MDIPPEVLEKIFELLDPKSIMVCRAVCRSWQAAVGNVLVKDHVWRKHCESDFNDIWQSAQIKCGLSLFYLYKSLSLWQTLPEAITEIEFAEANDTPNHNITFQILPNGIIGILKRKSVVYYDINTLKQLPDLTIIGNEQYLNYKENEHLILLHSFRQRLTLRKKEARNVIATTIYSVKLFLMLEDVIYYVIYSYRLYKRIFVDNKYISVALGTTSNVILTLGHENGACYVLTEAFELYTLENDVLKFLHKCESKPEKFEMLRKYNFANNVDWTNLCTSFAYLSVMKMEYPVLRKLLSIRTHGPVVFAMYEACILYIFYSVYTTSLLHLLNNPPIKVLLEPENELEVNLINVDAIEGMDSHTIVIGKNTKIHIIHLKHTTGDSSSSSSCCSSSQYSSSSSGGKGPPAKVAKSAD